MTASGAMVRPQNGQVVYVDLSEPDTVTFFNQDEAVAGLDGMFESVKSHCLRDCGIFPVSTAI